MNDEYIRNDTNNTELKLSTICFRLQEDLYKYIKELQEKTGKNESEVIRSILYAAKNNNSSLYSTYDKNQLFALMNKILEIVINNITNK